MEIGCARRSNDATTTKSKVAERVTAAVRFGRSPIRSRSDSAAVRLIFGRHFFRARCDIFVSPSDMRTSTESKYLVANRNRIRLRRTRTEPESEANSTKTQTRSDWGWGGGRGRRKCPLPSNSDASRRMRSRTATRHFPMRR